MTVPDSYTQYPRRQQGYDHDLYKWSNMHRRSKITWLGGKRVAVWICVSLEWFPIIPGGAFKASGHMQTAYPDYRHYTARDYGNRVGAWRFLEAFDKAGITASFATNAAVAERYPELIDAVLGGGHEIIAHSTDMNGTIDSSLTEDAEESLVRDAVTRLESAIGMRPKGWLSIDRQQSFRTLDILRDNGLTYCCDWVNDELPYSFANGMTALPLNHELSDRQIVMIQQNSADSWAQSMRDAFDWLVAEAAREDCGRMLPIHLTPYIMGLPYRIGALETLLTHLGEQEEAGFRTGLDLVTSWQAQQ